MGKRSLARRGEAESPYRISRRQFLITGGALVAVAACSTAPVSRPAANLPEGTVKLTAWTIGPDAPSYYRRDNLVSAAEALNKELTDQGAKTTIEVDATFESGGSWDDYKQKFVLAAEAKQGPDIILAGHEDMAPWAAAGYVISLDQLLKKYESKFKDVIPTLWDAMKLKGQTYAIPQDTEARPIYYRKDLLAKLGWSKDKIDGLPDAVKKGEFAWPDFVSTAKEAIAKGVVEPGMGWYHRSTRGNDFYMFYYQQGGEMQERSSGKLVLVPSALEKYYQLHYNAVKVDKITPENFIGLQGKQWHETVTAGKVLFYNAGTWTWKDWQATYKVPEQDLWNNVGFTLIPAAQRGARPVTLSHPLVYMVAAGSPQPELALRLIADATTPQLNSQHSVTSAHLAILTTQSKDPTYQKDKFLLATQYMLDYTTFIPNHPKFGTYDEVVFRFLTAVEQGQVMPKQAADQVVSELKTQLKDELIVR